MAYVSLEKLLDKTDGSIYKLVVLASKRALEVAEGQPKLVDSVGSSVKPSIIALYEIMENKVHVKESKSKVG
jgi:DNA-directed RNA polymerase omega subunit